MTQNQQINLQEIFNQAQQNSSSLAHLLQIGRKQGFQNTINRRLIWPFLIGLNLQEIKEKPLYTWVKQNQTSLQYELIKKDAERSLSNFKAYQYVTNFHMVKKQKAILTALNSLFIQNQQINYIQGFHDIAAFSLTFFDNSTGYYFMRQLSLTYFYDFLTFQFKQLVESLSGIVYELVTAQDSDFKKYLHCFVDKKILAFIFPWIMTFFVHSISSLKTLGRIWDYLLCTGPHGILYLTAALILSSKDQLKSSGDYPNEANIHEFFQQKMKKSALDVEQLIEIALVLQQKRQILQLQSYKKLHPKSKYRQENFCKILPIHAQFHQNRRKQLQKNRRFETVAKVGGVALILATAFLLRKHVDVKFSKQ